MSFYIAEKEVKGRKMDTPSGTEGVIDVSVILPALDEERTIGECITRIRTVFQDNAINGEIIVADSSNDRTPEDRGILGGKSDPCR